MPAPRGMGLTSDDPSGGMDRAVLAFKTLTSSFSFICFLRLSLQIEAHLNWPSEIGP